MKIPLLITLSALPVLLIPSCRRAGPGKEDQAEQKAAVEQLDMERWQLARERAALQEELAEFDRQLEAAEIATDARGEEFGQQKKALAEQAAALEAREKALVESESESEEEPPAAVEEGPEPVLAAEPVPDFIETPDLEWDAGELPAVADYGTFYEDLAPHGDWFETSDYGYIWRPTVVVQVNNWRPYCDGRWVWTDCGWSWVSNEPFGWATYHYGRWTMLPGHGWVWVPGHRWAPAWVCWRQGGSHIGWAPLPPECADGMRPIWGSTVEREFGIGSDWFCFVKTQHFAGDIRRHCLARRENRALLPGTTNVTLIHERRGRIHAGGPNYDDLCRRLGRRLPQLRIDLDRVGGDRRCGVVSGGRLLVTAPTVNAAWNSLLRPGRLAGRIEPHDDPRHSHAPVREAIEKISTRRDRDRVRAEERLGSVTTGRLEVHRREQLARQRAQAIAQLQERDRNGRSRVGGKNLEVHPGGPADHGDVQIGDRGSVAREERRHVPHERKEAGEPPRAGGADVGLAGRVKQPGTGQGAKTQDRPGVRERGTRPDFGRIEPHSAATGGLQAGSAEKGGQIPAEAGNRRTGGRASAGAARDGRDQQAAMLRERLEQARQAQLADQQEAERTMRRQREEAEQARLAEQQEQREKTRRVAMGELQRKQEQEEAMRKKREQTRQAQAAEQQRQQEEARRQAQEEAMRRQQEQARQAREAAQRRQQEEARRQAQEEGMRRQQEQARQAQEAAQRRQQEEARRQAQEGAMRRQQEQARQAREAAQRRQQEEARRQAQEEGMRRQQEQARQAQEAAQRRAQEEAARRQQEGRRRGRGR